MTKKNNWSSALSGAFHFMRHAYGANWQFRWSGTPYLAVENNKGESIAGHMWSCIGLWLALRHLCPKLDSLVDSIEIYETLWGHDLGEIYRGDVSLVRQLKGEGTDKSVLERAEIKKMVSQADPKTQREILDRFDRMEKEPEEIDSLETLVAIFVDMLSGNHFALTFGRNQKSHSDIIQKIIDKYQVPYFKRLVQRLLELDYKEAAQEVKKVITYHVSEIKRAGIRLDTANFGNLLDS